MMVVVGNDGADDSAYDQCADPVAAVHAAMIVMVMAGRWRRRMVMLYCNGAAVVDGTASVHHRLGFVMGTASVNSGAMMDGTASLHHGLAFMMRRFMYGRAVMGRAALVHHGLCLVMLCAPVHAGPLLFGNVLVNRRALMPGIASMHGRSCLMAGAAFLYRPDLLCMCRSLAAGVTGRRGFRNSHDERGAEKTCHQCDCQYFL